MADSIFCDLTPAKRADIEAALKARGIRMAVGSCGCCQSPWVSIEVDGVMLVKDAEMGNFNCFDPGETEYGDELD